MFDYAQRFKLALKDMARRSAMKLVAGVILALASGFLIAALWSFLADTLEWGPAMASLAVGGLFLVAAGVIWAMSRTAQHQMPTKEDLRREVEARASLAAEAAAERARAEAARLMDMAGNKVVSLMDDASYRASKLADDTERRVFGAVRNVAESTGLTERNIRTVRSKIDDATDTLSRASNSNAGSIAKIVGAFAVGVTLAAKLSESRGRDNAYRDDIL